MDKNEIIDRLERLARCAIHTEGELPFVMSLDDGIAIHEAIDMLRQSQQEPPWIPCSERLPDEYGEYRITWVTSLVPSKRFIGDSEYEVTSVWDEERKGFKGEWLLDEYIKHYPDVKVIAWKPLEEPYQAERRTDG